MTLPTSGLISFADINTELQLDPSNPISLNDPLVRTLAGKPSPQQVSFEDLHGKSYSPPVGIPYVWTPSYESYAYLTSLYGITNPTTFQGVLIQNVLVTRYAPGHPYSDLLEVQLLEQTAVVTRNIKAVSLAGLTIPITRYDDGSVKVTISIAHADITPEQATHIINELTGKTSTIFFIT